MAKKEVVVEKTDLEKERQKKFDEKIARLKKAGYTDCLQVINGDPKPMKRFSSGHPALDLALGGGVPRGKVIECYGAESSGKSSLCIEAAAAFQKASPDDPAVLYVDFEHSFDPSYAKALGIDLSRVVVAQPDTAEDGMNLMIDSIDEFKLIICDSVAAMTSKAEIEKNVGESTVCELARIMSTGLRQIVGKTGGDDDTTFIFVNQIRDKIGGYGNPTTTPGGKALKFYSSIRVEAVPTEKHVDKKGNFIARTTKFKVVKNKTSPPFREAEVRIAFGEGFDVITGIFDVAVKAGVIVKKGVWFTYGTTLIQGEDAFISKLKEDQKLFDEISLKCGGGVSEIAGIETEDEVPEEV